MDFEILKIILQYELPTHEKVGECMYKHKKLQSSMFHTGYPETTNGTVEIKRQESGVNTCLGTTCHRSN